MTSKGTHEHGPIIKNCMAMYKNYFFKLLKTALYSIVSVLKLFNNIVESCLKPKLLL